MKPAPRMLTVVYVTFAASLWTAWLAAYGWVKYHDPWMTPRMADYFIPYRYIQPIVWNFAFLMTLIGFVIGVTHALGRPSVAFAISVGAILLLFLVAIPY